MELVDVKFFDGAKHMYYDNGLFVRKYEGLRNERWMHKDNYSVSCSYLWFPKEGWKWVVRRNDDTVADYPGDQFELAVIRLMMEV